MQNIRVMVADDHPVVLAGLSMLLQSECDIEVVGTAETGAGLLNLAREKQPDIVIIDIRLPDIDGIQVTRTLTAELKSVGIVMLTQHDEPTYLKQSLDAGARGFVLKKSTTSCLINAVRGVRVGGLYVDPTMAASLFNQSRKQPRPLTSGIVPLTEREISVVKALASGKTAKETAALEGLSPSTVDTYKARAMEKIGAKSRAELVRFALSQGWLN